MDAMVNLLTRRSIRKYKPDMLPREIIDRIVEAGTYAPTGKTQQSPIIVAVTRREQQLLEEHRELLQTLGLFVDSFGETEAAIRAIPMILGQPQAGELLREVIDQLEGERGVVSLEKRRAGILALACKKAVKPGERLSEAVFSIRSVETI